MNLKSIDIKREMLLILLFKAVQRMLGHASAAVTLDVYADLFDDDLDGVATALDRAAMQSDVANLLPKVA